MTNNKNSKSAKYLFRMLMVVFLLALGTGIVLYYQKGTMFLFMLDFRLWPNWVPKALWLLTGVVALNTLLIRNLFVQTHSPGENVSSFVQNNTRDKSHDDYTLQTLTRFFLFVFCVMVWYWSNHSLEKLFYPFAWIYKMTVSPWLAYHDLCHNDVLQYNLCSWPFLRLPILLFASAILMFATWLMFGLTRRISLWRFLGNIAQGVWLAALRISRIGLLGQVPLFYVVCGCLYPCWLFACWFISAFYRRPLEYYMATGILSWRLLFVPCLLIVMLILICFLVRRKKYTKDVTTLLLICCVCFCGHATANAEETAPPVAQRLSFAEIPDKYPHAKRINDKLYLLEKAQGFTDSGKKLEEAVATESKLAADGGYLADKNTIVCFAALAYDFTGGRYEHEAITFRLRFPLKIIPGKKYPLILHLHGRGESNDDNIRQLAHLQSSLDTITGKQSADCFILSPHCPSDNKDWSLSFKTKDDKGDAPLIYVKEILDTVVETWPVDRSRISVMGVCSGANAAWDLASQYPDLFCALAATTISLPASPERLSVLKHLNFWLFNNDNDKTSRIEPLYEARDILKNMNASIYLTVRHDGHNSWTKAFRDDRIITWLAAQKKGCYYPPPGVVLAYHRTWYDACWQIMLPIILIAFLLIVQNRSTKSLPEEGTQ